MMNYIVNKGHFIIKYIIFLFIAFILIELFSRVFIYKGLDIKMTDLDLINKATLK